MAWTEEQYAAHQRASQNRKDEESDVTKQARENLALPKKPSKYRNQRCTVGLDTFDSKREADHWLALKARAQSGEITHLARQVPFPLHCPRDGVNVEVCLYVADFTWRDAGVLHVGDAKGVRTQMYALKRKWMFLEHGIEIEEM